MAVQMTRIKLQSDSASTERGQDICSLAILILVACAIGLWRIATSVAISKDGVQYIELAQTFPSEPLSVIKGLSFGYPFLVFAAHKLAAAFGVSPSALAWACSAQSVTLLCRVLSLIPLYFIGKLLVGAARSFWAVGILIILPYPAEFGADALRDWPHVLFLAAGFLLLLRGAMEGRWWMFAGAGLAGGLGHLIRPECAQLVVYGVLWIVMRLAVPKPPMRRGTLVAAGAALLVGFAIPAAPYMAVRGQILPEKLKEYMTASAFRLPAAIFYPAQSACATSCTPSTSSSCRDRTQSGAGAPNDLGRCSATMRLAGSASGLPAETVKGLARLAGEMSDNLMYYFVPALLIGAYARIRQRIQAGDMEKFFVPAFVLLNVLMMIMLRHRWGYISRRHCLPLAAVLIFYVPVGLEILAQWLEQRFSRDRTPGARSEQRWFFILLAIGVGICTPKLLRPLGADKQGYRDAAEWLRQNSRRDDVISVPDRRISFYAERKGIEHAMEAPVEADYTVRIVEDDGEPAPSDGSERQVYSAKVDRRKRNKKWVVVYRAM